MNAAGHERAPDQGPVGFDEAQRPGDRHIPDQVAHEPDLFEHPIEQLRAVPPAHQELLDARPKDAALDLQLRSPRVPLGVDHPDPLAGYDDMADVRLRARDAAVMTDRDAVGGQGFQPSPEAFLADRTPLPSLGALPLVRMRDGETTQPAPFPASLSSSLSLIAGLWR